MFSRKRKLCGENRELREELSWKQYWIDNFEQVIDLVEQEFEIKHPQKCLQCEQHVKIENTVVAIDGMSSVGIEMHLCRNKDLCELESDDMGISG